MCSLLVNACIVFIPSIAKIDRTEKVIAERRRSSMPVSPRSFFQCRVPLSKMFTS